jgi:hypothetical protein
MHCVLPAAGTIDGLEAVVKQAASGCAHIHCIVDICVSVSPDHYRHLPVIHKLGLRLVIDD